MDELINFLAKWGIILLIAAVIWIVVAWVLHRVFTIKTAISSDVINSRVILERLFETWPDSEGNDFRKYQGIIANGIGLLVGIAALVWMAQGEK